MKTFTYVIAPEGCFKRLTPGRKYEAQNIWPDYGDNLPCFTVTNDIKKDMFCLYKECAHLNNQDWIIPEIGQWPKDWTEQQKNECLRKAGIIEEPTNDNQGAGCEDFRTSRTCQTTELENRKSKDRCCE